MVEIQYLTIVAHRLENLLQVLNAEIEELSQYDYISGKVFSAETALIMQPVFSIDPMDSPWHPHASGTQ